MANKAHAQILEKGVDAWNKWRQQNPLERIDLSSINLRDARLPEIDFSGVDLTGANLTRAYLPKSNLNEANLYLATLDRADLRGASLWEAVLVEASLEGTKCYKANFEGADIFKSDLLMADLGNARLAEASLRDSNLKGANLGQADLRKTILDGSNLNKTNLFQADLTGASLVGATLVKTNLEQANLTDSAIAGMFAYDIDLVSAIQSGLVISGKKEPVIAVDDFEAAQFVYLLLNNTHIQRLVDFSGRRAVLILGAFPEGETTILEKIRAMLREMDYVPLLMNVDQYKSSVSKDALRTLMKISRFCIIDAGNLKELEADINLVADEFPRVAVQPIASKDYQAIGKVAEIKTSSSVLPLQSFDNEHELDNILRQNIIEKAIALAVALDK